MIYALARALFELATRVFFRRVEVEHLERIPMKGPVLLLANHPNGLVDPFLLMLHLRREVNLTAKSTLQKNPFLRLLFKVGRVVAIHRRQDLAEGADPSQNMASLAEVRRRLAEDGAVCLFPEGISHNQPQLQPLKTGAGRVALEYVDLDGDPGGLQVVPLGLDYTEKQAFRSSALVRVAEPIVAAQWRREHPQGDAKAFMQEVDRRIRESSLNFETRKASVILSFAAQLWLTEGREPGVPSASAVDPRRELGAVEDLQAAAARLAASHGAELEALGSRIRLLMAKLGRLGLHPRELFLDMSPAKAAWFTLREAVALTLGLPLAAWGALNHLAPYLACRLLTALAATSRDVWATYAVFSAALFFPLWWTALATTLFLRLPWWAAAAWLASLVPGTWAALRYLDRAAAVLRRVAAFSTFLLLPALRRELAAEARAILAEMDRLLGLARAA